MFNPNHENGSETHPISLRPGLERARRSWKRTHICVAIFLSLTAFLLAVSLCYILLTWEGYGSSMHYRGKWWTKRPIWFRDENYFDTPTHSCPWPSVKEYLNYRKDLTGNVICKDISPESFNGNLSTSYGYLLTPFTNVGSMNPKSWVAPASYSAPETDNVRKILFPSAYTAFVETVNGIKPGEAYISESKINTLAAAWALFLANDISGSDTSLNGEQEVGKNGLKGRVNSVTWQLDGSNIYGSTPEETSNLRYSSSSAHLYTSKGYMKGDILPSSLERSGIDPRSNAHVLLASLHSLFIREHNRIVDSFNPKLMGPRTTWDKIWNIGHKTNSLEYQVTSSVNVSDDASSSSSSSSIFEVDKNGFEGSHPIEEKEELETPSDKKHNNGSLPYGGVSPDYVFNYARLRVVALIQSITYNEWVPAVLGINAVSESCLAAPHHRENATRIEAALALSVAGQVLSSAPQFGVVNMLTGNTTKHYRLRSYLGNSGISFMLSNNRIEDILLGAIRTRAAPFDLSFSQRYALELDIPSQKGANAKTDYIPSGPCGSPEDLECARDLGSQDYGTVRSFMGCTPLKGWDQVVKKDYSISGAESVAADDSYSVDAEEEENSEEEEEELIENMNLLYGNPSDGASYNADLVPGLMVESGFKEATTEMGVTATRLIAHQLQRTRDSDPDFFLWNALLPERELYNRLRLRDVVLNNLRTDEDILKEHKKRLSIAKTRLHTLNNAFLMEGEQPKEIQYETQTSREGGVNDSSSGSDADGNNNEYETLYDNDSSSTSA